MKEGYVYWITGLSGAGKTTLGNLLYERIHRFKDNVFMLDGDIGRWAYNDAIGYSKQEREEGAYRNGRVCKMISDQGIDVICCTVSMFDGVRNWNRKNIRYYKEIYLEVPLGILIQRDQKGLYTGLRSGRACNVVGMDIEVEFPKKPHLRIINDGKKTPLETLEIIWQHFPEFQNYNMLGKV